MPGRRAVRGSISAAAARVLDGFFVREFAALHKLCDAGLGARARGEVGRWQQAVFSLDLSGRCASRVEQLAAALERATLLVTQNSADTGARVEAVAEMGAPSAGPVQQLLEAVQASAPPLPLLQRLPPGGVAYGATALSLAPFRTTLNVLPDAALRALLPRTRLNATDATALRTALAALTAQENLAVAATARTSAGTSPSNPSVATGAG